MEEHNVELGHVQVVRRQELVEEWYVAKLEGNVALFASRVLVDGVMGVMEGGTVLWGPIFDAVRYRYWDLFF